MSNLTIKKYEKDNSVKILFLGAMHGNEKCGTKAINKVISMIDKGEIILKKGTIEFIPICNPKAYEKNIREIDSNLNRIVNIYENPNSYEEEIATQVAKEIFQSDYMIDLHSSYTDDAPFAFLDYNNENNIKLIDASNTTYVVTGFAKMYEESGIVEWSTETFANKKAGTNGITIECGNHYKEESALFAQKVIINVLKQFDIIDGEVEIEKKPEYIDINKIILKENEGSLSSDYQNFDKIKKDEVIATYNDGKKIIADKDCIMVLPNKDAHIGHEWFYLAEIVK